MINFLFNLNLIFFPFNKTNKIHLLLSSLRQQILAEKQEEEEEEKRR